jgi:hypothetical protein
MSNIDVRFVVLAPALVQLVAQAQVHGQLLGHLEVVDEVEVVLPAVAVHAQGREGPGAGGGDAQEEVGVGVAVLGGVVERGESIGEGDRPEQVGVGAQAVPFHARQVESGLEVVARPEPAHVVLELLQVVAEAGPGVVGLGDALQANAAPVHLEDAGDVR